MSANKKDRKPNILYMVFSVAVAIALWTYVVYVENPTLENPIAVQNVPIEFTNEELLRDRNLIVSGTDVQKLTVYFGGRRRDTAAIAKMDVKAVVDLSDILTYTTPTGTHALEYELQYSTNSSSLTVSNVSKHVVEVTVDRLVTKSIPLEPVYTGSIAEGYMSGDLTLSRDTVDVSGAEAAIGKIAKATVTLNRDNLSKTVSDTAPIVLLDENGKEIDPEAEGIAMLNTDGTVVITQNILMLKTVPLTVNVVPSATATNNNITVDIQPETVMLSGDPEDLEGLNAINIGTVDLKTIYLDYSGTYQIMIPNNTKNESNTTIATVTIKINDSGIALRRLSANNISYRNAAENDYVTIITQSLDVVLRGNEAHLDDVTTANIRIVADLTSVAGKKGTTTVPARVYVDGYSDVEAVGEYNVSLTISDSPGTGNTPPVGGG